MNSKNSVSIIGCGISGIFAALELKKAGIENVQLFDKSRGVGGRLATRRANDGKFDHGIQYIKIDSLLERQEIRTLIDNKTLAETEEPGIFIGLDGMTNIAKFLTKDLNVKKEFKLLAINEINGSLEMNFENNEKILTDSIILSSPIKQSLEIIEKSNINYNKIHLESLESLEYYLAIILMIESAAPLDLDKKFYQENPEGPISFIADNFKKNVSKKQNFYTLICSPKFSAINFEKDYASINLMLEDNLKHIFGPKYEILSNHKWRYSIPKNFYTEGDSINIGTNNFIGLCGDIFTNGRFDGAINSGISIASKYLKNEI
tara:strand:+ start:17011 stop:17967 length:957 start_codon:yes stop_codon:yes gene_type:complete